MNKKKLQNILAEALELKTRIASDTARLNDLQAVIKETYDGQNVDEIHGHVHLKTECRRSLNKARALEQYGKKATERVVTPEAVKRLGLSEEKLAELYDVNPVPAIYLSMARD